MRRFFLLYCLFAWSIHAPAVPPCVELFAAADFSHSGLYVRRDWGDGIEARGGRAEFLQWNAAEANRVSREWRAKGARRLLQELYESRARLEEEISGTRMALDAIGVYFGLERQPGSGRPSTALGFSSVEPHAENLRDGVDTRPREMVLNPLRQELMREAEREPLALRRTLPNGTVVAYRDTHYQPLEGKPIEASRVNRDEGGSRRGQIWIHHTTAENAQLIMADVHLRLERASGLSGRAQAEQLAHAMYGYFQAMPIERGSAAVGHAFWPGAIQALTRSNVTLPDGVDIRAMTMRQDAFVTWLLSTPNFRAIAGAP